MGAMEQYLGIMLAIYAVRAFFGFAFFCLFLRKCLIFQNENGKTSMVFGLFFT